MDCSFKVKDLKSFTLILDYINSFENQNSKIFEKNLLDLFSKTIHSYEFQKNLIRENTRIYRLFQEKKILIFFLNF